MTRAEKPFLNLVTNDAKWSDTILDEAMQKINALPDVTATFTGYFGGFTPNIAASIMQVSEQAEPLDPAFNPRWAEGVPNLGIEASVYRATSSYTGRPHKIAPAYLEPTNEMIDKWREAYNPRAFELVYEPYPHRVIDRYPFPKMQIDPESEQASFIPPDLHEQIMNSIRDEYVKQCDAELIGDVFNVPLCLLGVNCDHKSHKPQTFMHKLRTRWYTLCGKARWLRERFARRVYEFVSEYEFEEEEVDW